MKKLFLLMSILFSIVLLTDAQYFSTGSDYMSTGSNYSSTVYDVGASAPTRGRTATMDDDDWGGDEIDKPIVDPGSAGEGSPIGDAWCLLAFAALAAGGICLRRRVTRA